MARIMVPGEQPLGSLPAGIKVTCQRCGTGITTESGDASTPDEIYESNIFRLRGWRTPCPACQFPVFIAESSTPQQTDSPTEFLLSYGSDTAEVARRIILPKVREEFTVTTDVEAMAVVGRDSMSSLIDAMERARFMIFLLSPEFMNKPSLSQQLAYGTGKRKIILLLLMPCNVPAGLRHLYTTELTLPDVPELLTTLHRVKGGGNRG